MNLFAQKFATFEAVTHSHIFSPWLSDSLLVPPTCFVEQTSTLFKANKKSKHDRCSTRNGRCMESLHHTLSTSCFSLLSLQFVVLFNSPHDSVTTPFKVFSEISKNKLVRILEPERWSMGATVIFKLHAWRCRCKI
jgi:hypothetical protein